MGNILLIASNFSNDIEFSLSKHLTNPLGSNLRYFSIMLIVKFLLEVKTLGTRSLAFLGVASDDLDRVVSPNISTMYSESIVRSIGSNVDQKEPSKFCLLTLVQLIVLSFDFLFTVGADIVGCADDGIDECKSGVIGGGGGGGIFGNGVEESCSFLGNGRGDWLIFDGKVGHKFGKAGVGILLDNCFSCSFSPDNEIDSNFFMLSFLLPIERYLNQTKKHFKIKIYHVK